MIAYLVSRVEDQKKFKEIVATLSSYKCKAIYSQSLDEVKKTFVKAHKKCLIIISDSLASPKELESFFSSVPKGYYIFYISDKISPTDYKTITRSGLAESTDWQSALSDITRFLMHFEEDEFSPLVTQDAFSKQIVVTFIGAGNGAGNTTMAMELGIDLTLRSKNLQHGSVALLDLDLGGGSVCDYLGIEPRLDFKEITSNPQRLDGYMLEIMSSKHKSGLDIFSVSEPYTISRYNSQDPAVLSLLNCIVDNYSISLIDIPDRCPLDISEIIKNSDIIFCTGIFSVPSAKKIKGILSKIIELGISKDKVSVILTDADTNLVGGLSPRFNIESVFKGWNLFYIRRDRSFALECVDAGVSMIQTQSRKAICQDIQKISEHLLKYIKN